MSVEIYNGVKRYLDKDRQLYRTDGPAYITSVGFKQWWSNGTSWRADGPTTYCQSGTMEWVDSMEADWPTRSGGPALDSPNGRKLWYDNGYALWPKL